MRAASPLVGAVGTSVVTVQTNRGGRPPDPRLPAAPLLRQVELRGGPAACGIRWDSAEQKALERARHSGTVTLRTAEDLAVRVLGLLPVELWGDQALA